MKRSGYFYALKWTLVALLIVDIVAIGTIQGLRFTNSADAETAQAQDQRYKTLFLVLTIIRMIVIVLGIIGIVFENSCFVCGLGTLLFVSLCFEMYELYTVNFQGANIATLVFHLVLAILMVVYSNMIDQEGGDGCSMC